MGKRRIYTGSYNPRQAGSGPYGFEFSKFTDTIRKLWRTFHSPLTSNNVAFVAIVLVVLAFVALVPQRVHHNELKSMKKVLNRMTEEVDRAEVACLAAAEELCCLHSICGETTEAKRENSNISMCASRYLVTSRSEPVQAEKEGCIIRRAIYSRDASQKEIAIMSILYTDSFDHRTSCQLNSQSIK